MTTEFLPGVDAAALTPNSAGRYGDDRRMRVLLVAALLGSIPALAEAQTPSPTVSPSSTPPETSNAPPPIAAAADNVTPLGAMWRSTLVPGWGQRYKGETRKGWLLTGSAVALGAGTIAAALNRERASSAYFGETSPNADYEGLYRSYADATVLFNGVAVVTAGTWVYAVADGAFTPLEHLRIKDARIKDVFPALSSYYKTSPVLVLDVENRSSEPVTKVKVKFEGKEIMDVPAESEVVDNIPAGLARTIAVTAAFNRNVSSVGASEPQAVAGKITVEYEVGRKRKEVTRTATFTVYNRNAIVWDDMRKMAAWVTPRDPTVKELASMLAPKQVTLMARDKSKRTIRATSFTAAKSISQAAAYFDALGALSLTYISDPQAPFQYFEGNAAAVDYIAYPHETLARRSGDCDDLSALYASLLESSGIPAGLVDVPGHVFVMFDSGLTPEEAKVYQSAKLEFHIHNGTAWVPVEVTAVGKSFREAWESASTQVKKWSGQGKLKLVTVLDAQSEFPPAPPDHAPVDLAKAFNAATFAKLIALDATLADREEEARQRRIADIRDKSLPEPMKANQIGIVYAKDGQLVEAAKHFNDAIASDPKLFKAYNNLANVQYLLGNNAEAVKAYEQALSVGGESAPVLVNLATIYFEMGDLKNTRASFERAVALEPVYEREYPDLAAASREGSMAAKAGAPPAGKASAIGAGERDPRRSRWTP